MSYRQFSGTINSAFVSTSTLSVGGNVVLASQAGATTTIGTATSVNSILGATTFANDVFLNGNTTIGNAGTDTLTVTAAATFAEPVVMTQGLAVNGGTITTSQTTGSLFNTTTTTLNIGGAATAVSIGAATGTTTVNNSLQVNGDTVLGNADTDRTTVRGALKLANDANTFFTTVQALGGLAADYTLTLPPDAGTAGYILRTDGTGITTWVSDQTSQNLSFTTQGGATYTVATTDDVVLMNVATSAVTLPVTASKKYVIKKRNAGTGVITITPVSGQIYDTGGFAASTSISSDGESIEIATDGTNAFVI
jgi:hypothetical protein